LLSIVCFIENNEKKKRKKKKLEIETKEENSKYVWQSLPKKVFGVLQEWGQF
jgi:hypothetical protein